jgi:hypothetical protein
MATTNDSWYNSSAATSTAGNYIDWMQTSATTTATGSNFPTTYTQYAYTVPYYRPWHTQVQQPDPYTQYAYTVPYYRPWHTQIQQQQPDHETIRRNEAMRRRRQPLDRWQDWNDKRVNERIRKEESEASEIAKRLLLEYLDEKNKKNFAEKKPIEIESGIHQGVKYQIPNQDDKIKAWKGDKIISELCLLVKPPEWIPDEDKILAKLLYLRNDEATALRTANHFNIKESLLQGLS